MPSRITRWGNSLGLRIPKLLAEQVGLSEGSHVDVRLEDGRIVVAAVQPPAPDLEELLAKVTDDNTHGEISTGTPVGREVW